MLLLILRLRNNALLENDVGILRGFSMHEWICVGASLYRDHLPGGNNSIALLRTFIKLKTLDILNLDLSIKIISNQNVRLVPQPQT